jgi:hypothetical protein
MRQKNMKSSHDGGFVRILTCSRSSVEAAFCILTRSGVLKIGAADGRTLFMESDAV